MDAPPPVSIARHTVRGSVYSLASSAATISLGLLRTFLMVTFLLPDEIGQAALALLYVNLGVQFGSMGFGDAFIQRPSLDNAGRRTFYSFHLLVGLASLAAVVAAAPIVARFYPDYTDLGLLILAFAGVTVLKVFNQPQLSALEKSLSFKHVAILDLAGALGATIAGPGLAILGYGVWAILAEYAGGLLVRFALLHFWLRPLPPRLGWDRESAAWLWQFGRSVWMGSNLTYLLDHFDDFWVGTVLGKGPLGLYSKAYEFARYPRRVVANPILSVFFPTFSHLQGDRVRLSRAFFRATSLIVRSGALFSLLIVLAAPEAFRLFLPDAWQPMRLTFQLMIVYTFLDPVGLSAQRLLTAAGLPGLVVRVRWVQLAVFVPAVVLGAAWRGIEGVALAAGLMALTGAILLFRTTFRVVDYSARTLWLWPAAALVGIGSLFAAAQPTLDPLPDLAVLALKLVAIPVLYGLVLWVFERKQLRAGLEMVVGMNRGISNHETEEAGRQGNK